MIHVINLSLVGVVLVLSMNLAVALDVLAPDDDFPLLLTHEAHTKNPPEAPLRHPTIVPVAATPDGAATLHASSKDSYSVIVEKDLFHPTRTQHVVPQALPRPLPKKTEQVEAPKPKDQLPRRSPTHPDRDPKTSRSERLSLQGVVLFGGYQRALIADLLRKPRDPMDVGIGDAVGRYTVKEILEDRVILTDGEADTRTLELMAEDKLNRRSHVVTPTPGPGPTVEQPAKAKKRARKAE